VATRLEPRDWVARRDLAVGLARARLDDAARREVAALLALRPELRADSTVASVLRTLDLRHPPPGDVVEF